MAAAAPAPIPKPPPSTGPQAVLEFRVVNPPDPFTGEYWQPSSTPAGVPQLAKSAGWGRLCAAIQRYVQWHSSGRSFLVAGHRGSGKTTIVESAIESVRRSFLDAGAGRRPLFVRVHGPDLFPPVTPPAAAPADAPAPAPAPPAAEQPAGKGKDTDDQPKTAAADAAPAVDRDPLLENVLTQICIALYRAAANEFIVSYRERIRRRADLPDWQSAEFYEMAAQFAHDIEDCMPLDGLRDYWERIGLLSKGVLFAQPENDADQGALEIIALSLAGQAYQVVSGKWEEERSDDLDLSQSSKWSLETAAEVKNLLAPFIGLFTGAAVVVKTGGATGVLLGLLSALTISFSVSYSGSRSRERKTTRKNTFAKDRTVSSLGRALPQLAVQFRRCGLHPVFVVDELDKVEDLPVKMRKLVSYLKDFASDRALFCFLTNRDYLEYIERETAGNNYVPEYSYFRDRIPVFYQPQDLRAYLYSVFVASQTPDYELLTYVLLHRARLHPLDLRRELGLLGDGTGNVRINVDQLRTGSRFDLLLQLAVEQVLADAELQEGIRANGRFALLVIDALYYPSRKWAGGESTLDTSDQTILDYLNGRMLPAEDRKAANDPPAAQNGNPPNGVSARDKVILLLNVRRVVHHLENPEGLVDSAKTRAGSGAGPSDTLLEIVPRRPLLKKLEADKWEWLFNAYGQVREQADIRAVTEGTKEDRDLLEFVSAQVLLWTENVDLGWIVSETQLPVIAPQWSLVRAAMDRVGRLEHDDISTYETMTDDKLAIEEYASKLRLRSAVLGQTLCCAWALAAGSDRETQVDKFLHALRVMFEELSLRIPSDDPVARMAGIYRTLQESIALGEASSLADAAKDHWAVYTGNQIAAARKLAPDVMRPRPWNRWLDRFFEYFQGGKTVFETAFEDLWPFIDPQPPAPYMASTDLRPRLAEVTLSGWGNILAGAVSADEKQSMPPWLSLPATSLLGLSKLAKRIASVDSLKLPPAQPPFDEWVRAILAIKDAKRASLLIAAEPESLYSAWTVSAAYPVLYVRASHLVTVVGAIAALGVAKPQDIGIDRLFFELTGDGGALVSQLSSPPASLVSVPNAPLAAAFLSLPCTYLLSETPQETPSKPACPYVVAPTSVDDLMSKLSSRPS